MTENNPMALATIEKPASALERALDALEDLVEESVRSTKRTRFADAERICRVGQDLLRATAEGVADYANQDECGNVVFRPGVHVAGGINYPAPVGDAHQNVHDQLGMLRDLVDPMVKQQKTKAAADRASELVDLQRALEKALPEHAPVIRARIEALLFEINPSANEVGHGG
jgi:hypothetical protein